MLTGPAAVSVPYAATADWVLPMEMVSRACSTCRGEPRDMDEDGERRWDGGDGRAELKGSREARRSVGGAEAAAAEAEGGGRREGPAEGMGMER